MHRTPSKVAVFWNFSDCQPRSLGLRPRSLCVSEIELTIYIYLFICKPRPTGWKQTTYRQTDELSALSPSNWWTNILYTARGQGTPITITVVVCYQFECKLEKYANFCKLIENYANLCIEPLQKLLYQMWMTLLCLPASIARPPATQSMGVAYTYIVHTVELAIYIDLFICKPRPTG